MANQYEVDPRQAEFLKNYLDPKSDTFSNALQSALLAGYSQEYSESITSQMPDWLSEGLGDIKMLDKVEKNLNEFLDIADDKIRLDATKFVGETVGKAKYSKRQELTGDKGEKLFNKDINDEEFEKLMSTYESNKGTKTTDGTQGLE